VPNIKFDPRKIVLKPDCYLLNYFALLRLADAKES